MFTHVSYTHQLHTFVFLSTLLHMLVHPNSQPRHFVESPHIAVFIIFFAHTKCNAYSLSFYSLTLACTNKHTHTRHLDSDRVKYPHIAVLILFFA